MNYSANSQRNDSNLHEIKGHYQPINKSARRFPPYGKQLNDLRSKGLVPAMLIIVSTDWRLGAAFPRIVIPGDADVSLLIFDYLAGLNVEIVHHTNEAELVSALIDAILAVKPKFLSLFNYDVAKQKDHEFPAITVIHPNNWRPE